MKSFVLCALFVAVMAGMSTHANAVKLDSLWHPYSDGVFPHQATSVGLDRGGQSIYVCRGKSEGEWQLGQTQGGACAHAGPKLDTIHVRAEVLAWASTARWVSVRGKYRGDEAVDLEFGQARVALCRLRKAGRTRIGLLRKGGCGINTRNGEVRVTKTYEVLVDPAAKTRQGYRRALAGVDSIADVLQKRWVEITRHLEASSSQEELSRLLKGVAPAIAAARRDYQRYQRETPPSHRARLHAHHARTIEPLLRRLAKARDALSRAIDITTIKGRCQALEQDIRRSIEMLTTDTALARRLKARQRISVLTELQKRMNSEMKKARAYGDRNLIGEVKRMFKPLPSLLADAIYHLQPWLDVEERNALYSSFIGGLPLGKAGSASKGLRRLLELFRPSDSSVKAAQAVDNWLRLMDDIAASIEQRALPELPKASASTFSGSSARTFALNLKRNGFSWVETQLEPDELDSGQTSRYLITPDLDWIVKRLRQKLPADVIGRVECLRHRTRGASSFATQLVACERIMRGFRGSALVANMKKDLDELIEIHAGTLNSRRCAQLKANIKKTRFHSVLATKCFAKGERLTREEARRTAFNDIRGLIAAKKLRAAAKKLKRLASLYPHAAIVYQLEYELRRAEQQKAEERLSAMKYAGRLQSIEARLPALEEVCARSVRDYRRARKRMRLALRRGQDGRAARLRISHDRSFFRACSARDQVQELLSAQITTGLVQAIRVTRETAPTCLNQWAICDRNP